MNKPNLCKMAVSTMFVVALSISSFAFAHEHEQGKQDLNASAEKTVTGEIVDMMCYVDHNAVGEGHGQSCGAKCMKNGCPVGISPCVTAFVVVCAQHSMNDILSSFCG